MSICSPAARTTATTSRSSSLVLCGSYSMTRQCPPYQRVRYQSILEIPTLARPMSCITRQQTLIVLDWAFAPRLPFHQKWLRHQPLYWNEAPRRYLHTLKALQDWRMRIHRTSATLPSRSHLHNPPLPVFNRLTSLSLVKHPRSRCMGPTH